MKSILYIVVITVVFSCSTSGKLTEEAFKYALIGQTEMDNYARLGQPNHTLDWSKGGKVFVYEFYSKGMYETPNTSKITYNPTIDMSGNREGLTFRSINTTTNDPAYKVYGTNISSLKVFFDNTGKSIRFEQKLSREQQEMFYEKFKRYLPQEEKK
ncbi:hypothetical protein SLH46_06440 [Draconibacterium sp. IB214405]|uniref:hypothetical protein n=1 Tax=Draconibacterium sp. IB214405 TaxID=3097352 RepID=UPI002A0D67D6|nr:hypothetical protein [Draconibacterium sp. IB214405]MDX8338811.1 hypothetical protein [Draconibacterium sp. IB214405]